MCYTSLMANVLIYLSASQYNSRVIERGAHIAKLNHASISAVFVQTAKYENLSVASKRQLQQNIKYAEDKGAKVTILYGQDPVRQLVEYVHVSQVNCVVLEKSLAKQAFSKLDDIDIYSVNYPQDYHRIFHLDLSRFTFSVRDTIKTLFVLVVCTLISKMFMHFQFMITTSIMVYILGIVIVSIWTSGYIYSLLASLFSVLCFNFFFTHPYFSLLSDPSYITTYIVMFVVALSSSTLTMRVKKQSFENAKQVYRTQVLLEMSQMLQKANDMNAIYVSMLKQLHKLLDTDLILYPHNDEPILLGQCPIETNIVAWVYENKQEAGKTTSYHGDSMCLYLPINGTHDVLGVVGIVLKDKIDQFEKNLWIAILDECGMALEKEMIRLENLKIEQQAKQEALRADLLRMISHDLRTPLTSISGNAGLLMENENAFSSEKRKELYQDIYNDAMRLYDLVENLLFITRIENGTMQLNQQPEMIEDIFREAIHHLGRNKRKHHISMHLEDDLLMANMDARLIIQVLVNLMNNAIKYTPENSHITLSAERMKDKILIEVQDDGNGVLHPDQLFEMFYTENNHSGDTRRGMGLGLSLCKSIVLAHGGQIWVENVNPHGACFKFLLEAVEVKLYE